jgi:hypothetical protein
LFSLFGLRYLSLPLSPGAVSGGRMRAMPLDLTDAELATAATACRAMAYQEGDRAKKMENPTVRGPL